MLRILSSSTIGPTLRRCLHSHAFQLHDIPPYWATYSVYAKHRWAGRTLLNIFSSEFRSKPPEYHKLAIESNLVQVNGEIVANPDAIVREHDLVQHTVHRHEPPRLAQRVEILLKNKEQEFLVIDKPGGLVIHAAGRFMRNTLEQVMFEEHGHRIFPSNRLDRLTSGVMVIPTSVETHQRMSQEFAEGTVEKEYIARCVGRFPSELVICDRPLLRIDAGLGLSLVHPLGKQAVTEFQLVRYDARTDTSVVLCKPRTGRTHQIRIHLQYLGHPIVRDPMYSNPLVWGERNGRGGIDVHPRPNVFLDANGFDTGLAQVYDPSTSTKKTVTVRSQVPLSEEAILVMSRIFDIKTELADWSEWQQVVTGPIGPSFNALQIPYRHRKANSKGRLTHDPDVDPISLIDLLSQTQSDGHQLRTKTSHLTGNVYCADCYTPILRAPTQEEMYIHLHAWRYKSSFGQFETKLPRWADEDWVY